MAETNLADTNLDDALWLVSDAAAPWLERAAAERAARTPLVQTLQRFRKELSAARAALVVAQAELRERGREKFPHAEKMFFTPVGLEQATDAELAAYKAGRFAAEEIVVDGCCGIGGDLLALATRGPVIGIDRDPVTAIFAAANVPAATLYVAEIADSLPPETSAWHIDPDRRADGRRTTQVAHYSPDETTLEHLRLAHPAAAFKLAPAAEVSAAWTDAGEREWISTRGECRQQMLWFERLARRPGERRATILTRGEPRIIAGNPQPLPPTIPPGNFLFEPDAAVLAADLLGVLAAECDLAPIAAAGIFLTGDQPLADSALATFRIAEIFPFDRKQLRAALRERNIGRLEIKKRGVQDTPEKIRRDLDLRGDNAAVLVVTPVGERVAAILAERVTAVR